LVGLALVCPGIVAQKGARPAQRVALRLANGVGIRQRRVPIPLQDPALFTDEPAWQTYIRDDPLTLRKLTIRGAVADLELNRFVADSAPLIHVPTLLMLAGRDRILDNQGVLGWFGRLGTSDKHLIEYPEAAHTFEFEPQPAPYFRDLAAWLEDRWGCERQKRG
jgi:alpha-beta hydrolase superfamily lysophospholipase